MTCGSPNHGYDLCSSRWHPSSISPPLRNLQRLWPRDDFVAMQTLYLPSWHKVLFHISIIHPRHFLIFAVLLTLRYLVLEVFALRFWSTWQMFDSPWLFLIFLPEFLCFLIRLWQAAFMPVVDFVCPCANIPLDLSATPRRYLSWPCLSPLCLPAFVLNCWVAKHLWRYSIGTVTTCLLTLLKILWRMYREVAIKVNNANGFLERLRMTDN